MHPNRRFLFRAVVVLVLSCTGLIHAQVNTTGKVTAYEQLEKVTVLSDEYSVLREYYERRAQEWQDSFIDLPPVRFAREPWEPPGIGFERSSVRTPPVRSSVRKTLPDPGAGHRRVAKKLQEIQIKEYHVPQALELSEVLKNLHVLAQRSDLEERGVNIVASSLVENWSLTPSFDAVSGKTRPAWLDYRVTITPPLRDISLRELLDAIVEAAVPPEGHESAPRLRYSIEEYGVVSVSDQSIGSS